MSRIRALVRESVLYGFSSIVSRFLNFLLVPFYTHVLSPSELGVSTLIFSVIAILNIIYQFGFDSAYLRLAHDVEGVQRKRLFSTAFLSQTSASIIFSLTLVWAAPAVGMFWAIPEAHGHLFPFAAGILVLDTACVVAFSHLRLTHSAFRFASIRFLNVVVNVAANLIFVLVMRKGLEGIFWANLLASAFTLLLVSPVIIRNSLPVFDFLRFRELLHLGLPFIPAGIFGIANEVAGRWFLARLDDEAIARLYPGQGYTGLALNGILGAAWKLGVLGLLLVQMYRMAWQPFFLQHSKESDAPKLFGEALRLLCLFIAFCTIPIMVFLDKLVAIPVWGKPIIHPDFWVGLELVPVILAAYALEAWFIHFTLGIYIAKQTRYLIFCNGMGAMVTVIGNALLIPRIGLWGAACSAVLCYLAMAILITRRSQKLYPISIPWKRLAPLLVWMTAGWALGLAVQSHPEHFAMDLRFLMVGLMLIIPFLIGSLSLRELVSFKLRAPSVGAPEKKAPVERSET